MLAENGRSIWRIAPEHPATEDLRQSLGCSRLTARLLAQRGVLTTEEAHAFLSPSFDNLADPVLLADAPRAVRRLIRALDTSERIYVHGDYDGDGITAAALWTRLLERLGGDVMTHVPHRRKDGYDIRSKFVETAREAGASLILTADCGIQRHQEVEEARRAGVDVIITDHHEVGPSLPPAAAVVNPHREDSRYPFRDLAGVGVSFRLGELLVGSVGLPVARYRAAFAELAAIGTITDIMPLLGDNRVFVKEGLLAMATTRRRGLQALLRQAGVATDRPVTSHDVGYAIGPRLNAVGRVDDPRKALDLLLTQDDARAAELAAELERANVSRRDEEQRILAEVAGLIDRMDLARSPCIVLDSEVWHPGVIGVVANRVAERYCRPTVLVARDPQTGMGRGSGRSVPAFNLHDALVECAEHLLEFGGHSHAAGFSIANDRVASFREALTRVAHDRLRPEDLQPVIELSAELSPDAVTTELLNELAQFEPWGHDNEEPLLSACDVRIAELRRIGRDRGHLKAWLGEPGAPPVEAVMWNGGGWADILSPGQTVDICYRARLNRYNGREIPQLHIADLRPSTGEPLREASR